MDLYKVFVFYSQGHKKAVGRFIENSDIITYF